MIDPAITPITTVYNANSTLFLNSTKKDSPDNFLIQMR